jgi:hypothetical protein
VKQNVAITNSKWKKFTVMYVGHEVHCYTCKYMLILKYVAAQWKYQTACVLGVQVCYIQIKVPYWFEDRKEQNGR